MQHDPMMGRKNVSGRGNVKHVEKRPNLGEHLRYGAMFECAEASKIICLGESPVLTASLSGQPFNIVNHGGTPRKHSSSENLDWPCQ